MKNLLGAWVPGLPHVLYPEKSPAWKSLNDGFKKLGQKVAETAPDVLVVHSSQWLSVLGTSFQGSPNPKGIHVDENWYDWGDLEYDFKTDRELSRSLEAKVKAAGFPTKAVAFEEFPIDTGTIVALRFLNPKGTIPVCVVSSWVYANGDVATQIGKAMQDAVRASGKKAVFVASSLLTTRFATTEINSLEDKISDPGDDAWNKRLLESFSHGDLGRVREQASEFSKSTMTDMQFNAFHWLNGALTGSQLKGEILAYGPQWGTGAAVISLEDKNGA